MNFDINKLKQLYVVDNDRIDLAKRRQAAVWRRETPDAWPVIMPGKLRPEQEAIPCPDFKEAFDDIDSMLCSQIRAACNAANSGSDAVPSVRGNYGTGLLLACVGLEQDVFPNMMPWLKRHLSRKEASTLTIDDITIRGTFERSLQYMHRHKAVMGDLLPLYCMDTQGPFDLAHLMLGDDIYLLIYDDPPLLHHVLEVCVELGVRTHEWMKAISGEPHSYCYHGNALYAENMGIRICEDTTAILGPDNIETFALPYTQRLAAHFEGAWIHYCGRSDALTEFALAIPEVRGINFGHIPGHLHDHPFEEDMQRCADAGKVYFGDWPRRDGESARDYLQRLHTWAAQGHLIPRISDIGAPGAFDSSEQALEFWYNL